MSCLSTAAMKEPLIDFVEANMINTNACMILDLDLVKMKKEDVEFASEFKLTVERDDKVHALVSWFDTIFSDLENPVTLSTSPYRKYTHWKNVVFYTDNNMNVSRGDVLQGSIAVRKSKTNFRELDVKISYHLDGEYDRKDFTQMYKIR
jgi:protein arginine N-methyltransferase 1